MIFLEDDFGHPYAVMDDEVKERFPDKILIEYDGRQVTFYLEPRLYFPLVGEAKHAADVDGFMGIRYTTGRFMSEHLEELIDDPKDL